MATKPKSTHRLLAALRSGGPQSPGTLMSRLGVSQPTLYRAAMEQPDRVVTFGAKRNRKLAAAKSIRELGSSIPVFMVSPEGEVKPVGKVVALYPSAYAFQIDAAPTLPRFYTGLPSFLADVKPQGYMGDAFAKKHTDLSLPPLCSDWSNEQTLEAVARRGEDLPGNVLVGAESFVRFQAMNRAELDPIEAGRPGDKYCALALASLAGQPGGTFLSGSCPKFGTVISDGPGDVKYVLVKFAAPGEAAAAKRARDLLICESIALEILARHDIDTGEFRLLESGGFTFLESSRYDRIGRRGRKRVLSLGALEGSWLAGKGSWASAAGQLNKEKKISTDDFRNILRLECFARLIANQRRGSDKLCFFWRAGDERATLAPVTNMAPCSYEDASFTFSVPSYDHSLLYAWRDALPLAQQFWESAGNDHRISAEFRKICLKNFLLLK